jgi:hypothetical protein
VEGKSEMETTACGETSKHLKELDVACPRKSELHIYF